MTIFGWFDVALFGLGVLTLIAWTVLWVRALFKRHKPQGETYVAWPRWLPHRHDWQPRTGRFETVPPFRQWWWETCMRCRRQRNEYAVTRDGRRTA